jgi:hypothetical protein
MPMHARVTQDACDKQHKTRLRDGALRRLSGGRKHNAAANNGQKTIVRHRIALRTAQLCTVNTKMTQSSFKGRRHTAQSDQTGRHPFRNSPIEADSCTPQSRSCPLGTPCRGDRRTADDQLQLTSKQAGKQTITHFQNRSSRVSDCARPLDKTASKLHTDGNSSPPSADVHFGPLGSANPPSEFELC